MGLKLQMSTEMYYFSYVKLSRLCLCLYFSRIDFENDVGFLIYIQEWYFKINLEELVWFEW